MQRPVAGVLPIPCIGFRNSVPDYCWQSRVKKFSNAKFADALCVPGDAL